MHCKLSYYGYWGESFHTGVKAGEREEETSNTHHWLQRPGEHTVKLPSGIVSSRSSLVSHPDPIHEERVW